MGNSLEGIVYFLIFMWVFTIIFTIVLAVKKGYNGFLAFLLGLFIPLLGSTIVVALLPDKKLFDLLGKKKQTSTQSKQIKQTEYRGEKDISNDNNWICGKCGTINDIFLPNCKKCGKEYME